jgi:hypothetical protein
MFNFIYIDYFVRVEFSQHVLIHESFEEIFNACLNIFGIPYLLHKTNKLIIESEFSVCDDFMDIDPICTPEWCVKRLIQNEIDEYIKLVRSSKVVTSHLKRKTDNDYKWYVFDVLGFWRCNENCFPYLARLAKRVLSGTTSSACVERLFSMASNLYTHRRKNLSAPIVQAHMRLKLNLLVPDAHCIWDRKLVVLLADFKDFYGKEHPLANTDFLKSQLISPSKLPSQFADL